MAEFAKIFFCEGRGKKRGGGGERVVPFFNVTKGKLKKYF